MSSGRAWRVTIRLVFDRFSRFVNVHGIVGPIDVVMRLVYHCPLLARGYCDARSAECPVGDGSLSAEAGGELTGKRA